MSPNERFQPSFSLNFCARRPFYLAENDATSEAMSSRHVPCYAADLVALSIVSRDGKDELQCLGHIMRQKRSSKITPMAFSRQSLASYLDIWAENGHDIRQMTINCVLSDEGKEARSWYVDETYFNVKGK